ncbi:MAG: hypothetical protein VX335_02505 [Pseudomonadota bacterium]|nr:hypothetical protein [Pseudomonadota bacterium]
MSYQSGINKSIVKQTNYKTILEEIFEEYAINLFALIFGAPGAYIAVFFIIGFTGITLCSVTGIGIATAAVATALALIPVAGIFLAYGIATALIIAAAAILAGTIALVCSIIPSLYIITNLCFMSYFATNVTSLIGTVALSWQILGIISLSLGITNLFIDLIISSNIGAKTSDSIIFSLGTSIASFILVSIPTFFICTSCGLPAFNLGVLSSNISFLSAFNPTNALNLTFLVTAVLTKLPLSVGVIKSFNYTASTEIENYKQQQMEEKEFEIITPQTANNITLDSSNTQPDI